MENDKDRLKFLHELSMKGGNPKAIRDFLNEAERSAKLNKNKDRDEDDSSFWSKAGYTILGVFLAILVMTPMIALLAAYSVFAYGYVAVKLWAWFIIPFFGVKALTLLQAAGIMLLVRHFTYVPKTDKTETDDDSIVVWSKAIIAFALPWLTLLLGYIIHRLM